MGEILCPVAKLAANGYRFEEGGSDTTHQKAPPPKDVAKWFVENLDYVEANFDKFLDENKHWITEQELDITNSERPKKAHVLASAALGSYRLARMTPVRDLGGDAPSHTAGYEKRYKTVGPAPEDAPLTSGKVGHIPEDAPGDAGLVPGDAAPAPEDAAPAPEDAAPAPEDAAPPRKAAVTVNGYRLEDIYRCVVLFSFFNQRRKGTTKLLNVGGPPKNITPVPYIDKTYRPGIADAPTHPETWKSISNMTLRQQFSQYRTNNPAPGGSPVDVAEASTRMVALSMRTGLGGQMAGDEAVLADHLAEKHPESVLPSMTRQLLDGTLEGLAKGMRIATAKHGMHVVGQLIDEDVVREFVSQAAAVVESVDEADETPPGGLEAHEALLRESFAKQSSISTLGDCAGELERARIEAGFEDWRVLNPNPAKPGFQLRPHQLVDAAWMVDNELGPLRGSLLANDPGTGKTYTYLMAIVLAARRQEAEAKRTGKKPHYSPTLVVCPNTVLGPTFDAAKQIGLLVVYVYYESDGSTTDPKRRTHTINKPDLGRKMDELADASDDIRVSEYPPPM